MDVKEAEGRAADRVYGPAAAVHCVPGEPCLERGRPHTFMVSTAVGVSSTVPLK